MIWIIFPIIKFYKNKRTLILLYIFFLEYGIIRKLIQKITVSGCKTGKCAALVMVYVQHKIDVLLKPEINNRRELNNSIEFDLYNIFLHFI